MTRNHTKKNFFLLIGSKFDAASESERIFEKYSMVQEL